jgi:hypothetical protein
MALSVDSPSWKPYDFGLEFHVFKVTYESIIY